MNYFQNYILKASLTHTPKISELVKKSFASVQLLSYPHFHLHVQNQPNKTQLIVKVSIFLNYSSMNSAMKTHNCFSWTTFRCCCHFHRLCLAVATAAPILYPPVFSSQPWEPGSTHSCRGPRTVQRWKPGSLDPCLALSILFQQKYAPGISFFESSAT